MGKLDKLFEEARREYLNRVRMYGERIARYDLVDGNEYDDTNSMFIYKYEGMKVFILMNHGEYVDYFEKEVN